MQDINEVGKRREQQNYFISLKFQQRRLLKKILSKRKRYRVLSLYPVLPYAIHDMHLLKTISNYLRRSYPCFKEKGSDLNIYPREKNIEKKKKILYHKGTDRIKMLLRN